MMPGVLMQIDIFDQEYNSILASTTYTEFAERMQAYGCRRCELCESRFHLVLDRGNPSSDVLIVSERPGENENATGKAFVGRAGALLDKMLTAIGLDSNQDVLIVNVVKCKPAIDRPPSSGEAEACLPYLQKQIELVRPRLIVLLGAVALKWMDPVRREFTMEEEAGRLFTLHHYPGIRFMVLYHPAFLLRDPRKKRVAWEHLQQLREALQSDPAASVTHGA